jgi:succinate dehydrogenase / fumarate reductase flavoprotein subunit
MLLICRENWNVLMASIRPLMFRQPPIAEKILSAPIPQAILDRLTDIAMPRLANEKPPHEFVSALGFKLPVRRCRALVLGSGAAGLRAAVELKRRDVDVAIATQSAFGGTSACSGSDKQTLHTANGADRGDDFRAMADALGAGGSMDEDTAYVEAVGSSRALASLQFMGLPIPQDRLGGVLRYQTDHDEVGRATSCGPRTSRLMVQALAREAIRLEVPVFNNTTGVRLLVSPRPARRSAGLLAIRPKQRTEENPLGLAVFLCDSLVIASGGPGELYRDSVYPRHCFGSLGLALEAGLEAVNLTESQFGIGTSRDGFPWNLSGTYVQSMPYVFSLDHRGRERNFLADYYRTTRELVSSIFRKGYQWPFHASRMLDFGSSLFDLAVFRETQAGRKVFMDFNRNPLAVPEDADFGLERLDPDVRAYLENSGALLEKPTDRLRKMNPLSIELYKRYKYDIAKDPLEFGINNQHMNGGLAVNGWGETSLDGCYAIGEAAGTHGVTRPGGAALNAGQVFGTRCAESIASRRKTQTVSLAERDIIEGGLSDILAVLRSDSPINVEAIRREVQARMSDHAGIICTAADVQSSLADASALNRTIRQRGVAFQGAYESARALQWRQMAIVSEAVLAALSFYVERGGGSPAAYGISIPFRVCRGSRRTDSGATRRRSIHLRHAARPPTRPGSAIVLRARLAGFPHWCDFWPQHLTSIGTEQS